MNKKLTKKQKEFADEYMRTGNATKSAQKVYDVTTYASAAAVGYENLNKPQIIEYTQEHVAVAKSLLFELMNNPKVRPETRIQAAKDIIDRIEGKAIQRNMNANSDTDKEYKWAD